MPNLRYFGSDTLTSIIQKTQVEIQIYQDVGFDAVMVENFNDTPFASTEVDDTVIAKLSVILRDITSEFDISIGLNILRNASVQAMKLACLYDLPFIRSNIWEGSYVTDQGIIHSAAKDVLDERRKWGKDVKIMADIHVKHAHPLGDFSLEESAENAFFRGKADFIVLSGTGTGKPTPVENVKRLNAISIKPIIGSGMTLHNMENYTDLISGAIVGTAVKKEGKVTNSVDPDRATIFAEKWKTIF